MAAVGPWQMKGGKALTFVAALQLFHHLDSVAFQLEGFAMQNKRFNVLAAHALTFHSLHLGRFPCYQPEQGLNVWRQRLTPGRSGGRETFDTL